jgi:hypothetical protein
MDLTPLPRSWGCGLPLCLDLEAIQLEDQYQNTEYGPEPIEDAIPTTEFNFNEVDDCQGPTSREHSRG